MQLQHQMRLPISAAPGNKGTTEIGGIFLINN